MFGNARSRKVKPYETIAAEFAYALVEERWEDAHRLLASPLQKQYSPEGLKECLNRMFSGYAAGPAKRIFFDPEFSMEDWPSKQERDAGWAYVSVEGDDFVEAVTVVIAHDDSRLLIRDIEWGRP